MIATSYGWIAPLAKSQNSLKKNTSSPTCCSVTGCSIGRHLWMPQTLILGTGFPCLVRASVVQTLLSASHKSVHDKVAGSKKRWAVQIYWCWKQGQIRKQKEDGEMKRWMMPLTLCPTLIMTTAIPKSRPRLTSSLLKRCGSVPNDLLTSFLNYPLHPPSILRSARFLLQHSPVHATPVLSPENIELGLGFSLRLIGLQLFDCRNLRRWYFCLSM